MKTLIALSLLFLVFVCNVTAQKKSRQREPRASVIADTVYIPLDLNDAIKQLDTIFSDSSKMFFKTLTEDQFSARLHLGFGTGIRNNWGLWVGSRLSRYFNDQGVYHPEDMSGIIFDSYYRHLNGQPIRLDEQVKYYQDYWEKTRKADLDRKIAEFAEYHVGDTLLYKYPNDYVSKEQENKYDKGICQATGVVLSKDEKDFFLQVKLIEACDKKGIIYYDSEGTMIYNKTTNKMERPKKRIIKYMRAGKEGWFNYTDWETNN